MVVTKPPGENTAVLHKPKEGGAPQAEAGIPHRAHSPPMFPATRFSLTRKQHKCEQNKHNANQVSIDSLSTVCGWHLCR